MGLLSQQEINTKLSGQSGWHIEDRALMKEFIFPTFADAMVFVNELAQAAEDMSHYPNIGIHANKVILRCHTHDLEGITEKDVALAIKAQEIEKAIFSSLS